MIKIYVEDNGNKVEVREIKSFSNKDNILMFLIRPKLSKKDIEELEKELTLKTERKCIVLNNFFEKVLGI